MIRITIESTSAEVKFPCDKNVLRYPGRYSMGDDELDEIIKLWFAHNPDRRLVRFHKNIIRSKEAEELELAGLVPLVARKPEPGVTEEPL